MPPKHTSPKKAFASASTTYTPPAGLKLLIVESPAKCKKIQEILGAGWRVRATMGHIRALKEDLTAIGFRTTWMPTYQAIGTKADAISALRREAAAAAAIYLASDDDREGEAIAWHTCILLGLDPTTTPRVTFHEITAPAITAAVGSPGRIDFNKFNAQQARSMLDMLIGFTLSPCLWRGVGNKPGLSAGRCQTPALRIIYDRDQEIAGHTASLSWRVTATTAASATATTDPLVWRATEDQPTDVAANALLVSIAGAPHTLTITNRQERVATSSAPLPFITSTLQQEASSRLGLNPKATMRAAQTLYEAGHITYMRTDNAVLSEEAKEAVAALVTARWGADYLAPPEETAGAKKKVVKRKKTAGATGETASAASATTAPPEAQAAHEGIRPTHLEHTDLTEQGPAEQRLYELIWRRTVQSQMAAERRDVTKLTATFTVNSTATTLTTDWERQAFAGWRVLDAEKKADEHAADAAAYEARRSLIAGQTLHWTSVTASENRTSAPSRYTEASLIRELESRGIGRPSTYAALVETVLDRGYVEKANIPATPVTLRSLTLTAGRAAPTAATRTEKAGAERDKLRTTALGRTVIEWLIGQFEDMLAYDFTATLESQLDEVAKGSRFWQTILTETWDRYKDRYDAIMASGAAGATGVAGATGGGSASHSTAEEAGGERTTRPKISPTSNSRVAEFGDGYKMVISKKGPLFVLEQPSVTPPVRFASVPPHLSITTATRADAEAAFATATTPRTGETLGDLDGEPVLRRSGKFGPYVTWRGHSVNCKPTDTLAEVSERLLAKADPTAAAAAVDRLVGPYRIRRGPYGLYMFKVSAPGATKKPFFVSIPDSTPWATLTPESAEQVYKLASDAKKTGTRKTTFTTEEAIPATTTVAAKKPRAPRKKKAAGGAGDTDD